MLAINKQWKLRFWLTVPTYVFRKLLFLLTVPIYAFGKLLFLLTMPIYAFRQLLFLLTVPVYAFRKKCEKSKQSSELWDWLARYREHKYKHVVATLLVKAFKR